ncbi:GGDEF domain-containing protein [Leucobacter insecticola]|uniref:GGDEF domain-containing protein n=1 Tax=Leucobacter insecticola TaxID=2714934 RepID=A0A6G8FIF2_9MICO|nr:GGDEF domain-containing protein [Leucobacter insecticola]QIM16131.1 GGDEF domain-containing protein [Leucobacter insecticola]
MSELQRLRITGSSSLFRRHNAHSLYLSSAGLVFSLTFLIDLLLHRYVNNQWLLWALLGVSLVATACAFVLGARVSKAAGLVAAFLLVAALSYYMSLPDDPQSVVSSVQALPLVAFYVGWFVRPGMDYVLMALFGAAFVVALSSNPLVGPEGAVGVSVAVHGMLSFFFCFSAGAYLWRRAERRAVIDPLTGAINRQRLHDRIEHHLRLRKLSSALSLVVIDFDDFKRLNDLEGHAAGDAALRTEVALWRSGVRRQDEVARIGGDEFVLLLPRTSVAEAQVIVARLRKAAKYRWSWGIAESRPDDNATSLLARADAELYAQKRTRKGHDHGTA